MIKRFLLALVLTTLSMSAPWGAAKAFADGDRIGCGTFCQSAGGYGAPGETGQPAATIVSAGTVTADSDGYAPVTLKCNLSSQCLGAFLLCLRGDAVIAALGSAGMAGYCGRSDLQVNPGATRTIAIPLPPSAMNYVRSHGPTAASVTANTGQSAGVGAGFITLISTNLTVAAS